MNIEAICEKAYYDKAYIIPTETKIASIDLFKTPATLIDANLERYSLTPHAQDQALELLKIKSPVKALLNLFQKDDKPYFKDEIEMIIFKAIARQKRDRRFFYDSRNHTLKGITGLNYKRIPNYDVIEAVFDSFEGELDERFSYLSNGDTKMHLFFKGPETRTTSINNFPVRFGVSVGNGEVGGHSLQCGQNMVYTVCTNGAEGKISLLHDRFIHTARKLREKFLNALNKYSNFTPTLDLIDRWIDRPAIFDSLDNTESINKLKSILKRYGVSREGFRKDIVEIVNQNEYGLKLNSFGIGMGINDYASNYLRDDPVSSQELIAIAVNVMAIQ